MGMVFGEVLEGLLTKRREGVEEEEEGAEKVDEEMDVDELQQVGKKGEELKARVVGEADMESLVALFKDIMSCESRRVDDFPSSPTSPCPN